MPGSAATRAEGDRRGRSPRRRPETAPTSAGGGSAPPGGPKNPPAPGGGGPLPPAGTGPVGGNHPRGGRPLGAQGATPRHESGDREGFAGVGRIEHARRRRHVGLDPTAQLETV